MNKMTEQVVSKTNNAEKEVERRVMQYQIEKEEKDAREEENRKKKIKLRNDTIKQTLSL